VGQMFIYLQLKTLSVTQTIQRWMKEWEVNDEMERLWKKVITV
jgi:hypothetical protein